MITRIMQAYVIKVHDVVCKVGIQVTLTYDPDIDPLAVQMVCHVPDENEVVWHFSRELMFHGHDNPVATGLGDIRFQYNPQTDRVLVCLKNVNGHADLSLPHDSVRAFLDRTVEVFPVGAELTDDLIEEALADILAEEA